MGTGPKTRIRMDGTGQPLPRPDGPVRRYLQLPRCALLSVLAIATIGGCTTARRFPGFEAHQHDGSGPTFQFADADATSRSPVVISTPGRALTNDDRVYRVDLQKVWLSKYVPEGATFRFRELVKCDFHRKGEFPMCDRYQFEDRTSGRSLVYFIYVGSWP
jgi:hypothetical protein